MKTVLFLECAQNFGGARIATIKMAKVLSKNHNVIIADFYGTSKSFVSACENSGLPFSVLSPGNPFYIKAASSKYERITNLAKFPFHIIKMRKIIKHYVEKNSIDIICVNGARTMLCLFGAKLRAKIVFFAHAWYVKQFVSKLEFFLLKHVPNAICCISEATRHALFNNGVSSLEKMFVVHNCIDCNDIPIVSAEISKEKGEFVIFHNGGFTKGKGQIFSLYVLKELLSRGLRVKMIFAGIVYHTNESVSYYDEFSRKIEDLRLKDHVVVILNKNGVLDYLLASDVLIHPSLTEGFPLALMEAQSMGKPIVANPVGGVTDMVLDGYTGILANHNDIDSFTNAIEMLLKDKFKYNMISNNSKELAKSCFSEEVQAAKITEIFNKI